MPPRKKAANHAPLGIEKFILLKKPLEHLGKQVEVPGSFWSGRMSAAERETKYKCTILDFSVSHRFSPDQPPRQAFQLQEMGVDGTGSLEKSNIESTKIWIEYPSPFLRFFYQTFPLVDVPSTAEEKTKEHGVDDDGGSPHLPADVLPAFPNLRLGRAPIYASYTVNSDTLVEMGPKSGQYSAEFECIITECDGRACGAKRSFFHKKGKGVSTSNLIAHLRERAEACEVHKAALKVVEASDKNCVEVDGEMVKIHNFSEAFECARPCVSPPPRPRRSSCL